MNKKAINVLEYEKIIEFLKAQAGSEITKKIISELRPFCDLRLIEEGLAETNEGVSLIGHKGPLPLGNFYDISGIINLAKKGACLSMRDLLQVLYNLKIARNVVSFLKSDLPPLPILNSMAEVLQVYKNLEEDIDRCILSEDEIADNASSELKQIRRSILRQNESLKTKMNHIINSSDNKTILQDAIVTMRDGRYVIPLKAEYRGKIPGIVHDHSATGATLFVEPQVIVNLNNELRELEIAEKAEIEKILFQLSGRVAEHYDGIKNNQELLVHMDLINAKGKLSVNKKWERPQISQEGYIELKEAKHPLLDIKKAVPINIHMGKNFKALIITGPNTGGKTVTLKTVGLLCMMAQTGLNIPASERSTLPILENIFADIGDEQSIEQSLSTFSSHMKNIVEIVGNANENSLVLLDELGAGTDPTEGAALAISIIEELKEKGALILGTTHYNELKKYAISTKGVENASMEFNVETLSPTYKLTIGIPGKSNAFEISKKLGLPPHIIDKSKHLMDGGDIAFEEVLSAISEDKKAAEAERDEAIMINLAMKEEKEALAKEKIRLEKEKERLLNEAKEKARGIIDEAKEVSLEVQEELRELTKLESLGERNKRFDESRKRIKDTAGKYKETFIKEVNDNPVNINDIKIGDRVKVISLSQNGEILSRPDDKGMITVKVGMIKAKVHYEDLKIIVEGKNKKLKKEVKKNYGSLYKSKAQIVSPNTNVQGQNLEEALENVSKYLDDAFMAGLREVTIIHGRGEGILAKGIRGELKRNKHVDEFRKGNYNEGGDGVTIVILKK